MAHLVPKIALADLQAPASCIAGTAFSTAAEKLAVALSRNRVAIVTLPGGQAAALKAGLKSLLARGTHSLPGCDVREWRAGGPLESAAIEEAYGVMESTARLVLSALSRSNMLRLRGDAFSTTLDDLPLPRSTQGSSCLGAKAFVDNFSHLSAAGTSAMCSNLFADPQEETSERGLLSVFYAVEARDGQAAVLSAWQVKDSSGGWHSVVLGEYEVAITLGHTMQHACAGLVQPGSHRVVGDPYACSTSSTTGSTTSSHGRQRPRGRTQLLFELRPRPAAVLDLRTQLEAAGHTVSARFSPMSVSCLMEQFESLLSPAKMAICTPDQQLGAAAHTAWEELQATLKRSKRRGTTLDEAPSGGPQHVTCNGNVRCSAEGLLNQQQRSGSRRQKQLDVAGEMDWGGDVAGGATRSRSSGRGRPSLAGAGAGACGASSSSQGPASGGGERRRDSLEPGSSALYIVRGRRCTVLDDCLQDDPADCITVCVRSFTGLERWFYCNSNLRCGALFEMFCARLGIALGAVKFLLRGERVYGASTPISLKMCDGEELVAVPESSDRLQQARELGPLFATVFGKAAAAPENCLPPL